MQASVEPTDSDKCQPLAGYVVHQEGQDDVDSDDEDPTIDPTHVPHTLQGTGFHGESRDPMLLSTDALDAEVERLLLALNSTGTSGNSQPDSRCACMFTSRRPVLHFVSVTDPSRMLPCKQVL